MPYELVQPPLTLDFRSMTKQELKAYFEWFMAIIPTRLNQIVGAVRETPTFENWEADFSEASLNRLGEWFARQVEVRSRTAEELQGLAAKAPIPMQMPKWELTNRTFSIAFDIGIYLSQVFLKSLPSLKWEQPLGAKKFIDYGQPVLSGSDRFNPVRMMVTLAYGLADKTREPQFLREIYDAWVGILK